MKFTTETLVRAELRAIVAHLRVCRDHLEAIEMKGKSKKDLRKLSLKVSMWLDEVLAEV